MKAEWDKPIDFDMGYDAMHGAENDSGHLLVATAPALVAKSQSLGLSKMSLIRTQVTPAPMLPAPQKRQSKKHVPKRRASNKKHVIEGGTPHTIKAQPSTPLVKASIEPGSSFKHPDNKGNIVKNATLQRM